MLSETVQEVIRQQGWSPDRKVSIDEWISQLVAVGYDVLPEAKAILENFGGLELSPVKTDNDIYSANAIRFDPVTDVLSEFERIQFIQKYLGQKLTPIGVLHPAESILLLGQTGEVFCEWGNIIGECGKSFEDALAYTLLFAQRKPVIHRIKNED